MDEDLFSFAQEEKPAQNLQMHSSAEASNLRQWQQEAIDQYFSEYPRDFLAVATPGAGKTTFALNIARRLLNEGKISRITIVTPTEHLKQQWAQAARKFRIAIDPNFKNMDGHHGSEFIGVAVTYSQVAHNPELHYGRTTAAGQRTLVILDEIHHSGNGLTWGEGLEEAFEDASFRLSLTGTPFRSDDQEIPFVHYEQQSDGSKISRADYTYAYGQALTDHIVRPVMFMSYSGKMTWRNSEGEYLSSILGAPDTKEMISKAWKTALDPQGQWIPVVLSAANERLNQMRQNIPDAGGLVIASDHAKARAYADELKKITGVAPTVVLSDNKQASDEIEQFSQSTDRWMVAVKMVSEGVDIPRLTVGVYATSTSTSLFFAQAIGRFVRSRRPGETASIFLPSVPTLTALANQMEQERNHVLNIKSDQEISVEELENLVDPLQNLDRSDQESAKYQFKAVESEASFDKVLYEGTEFDAYQLEDQNFIGIPGLLEPAQVNELLAHRPHKKSSAPTSSSNDDQLDREQTIDPRQLKEKRKQLSKLVSAYAVKTGKPHGSIHNALRSACGGPEVPQASFAQIQLRIEKIQQWFIGRD